MPEAILTFKLPDESVEHATTLNAQRYKSVLWDMDQWLRVLAKHGGPDALVFTPESARAKLWELIKEQDLIDICD